MFKKLVYCLKSTSFQTAIIYLINRTPQRVTASIGFIVEDMHVILLF